jgi:hypothetical protein
MNPLPRNNYPQQSSHLSQYTRQKMHNPLNQRLLLKFPPPIGIQFTGD